MLQTVFPQLTQGNIFSLMTNQSLTIGPTANFGSFTIGVTDMNAMFVAASAIFNPTMIR
jgi:hypothetical protein